MVRFKVVDLFSGVGGTTTGMLRAGCDVLVAANHWRFAVATHVLNHPQVHHEHRDLLRTDFSLYPDCDLAWASISCQGQSQAAQPARKRSPRVRMTHDQYRATAWAIVDLAECKEPEFVVVENVVEFRRWKLYEGWRGCLESLGYTVTENVLTASRWGVPQRRKRLFVIGHRGRAVRIDEPRVPEPAFGPHIDWDTGEWIRVDEHPSPNVRSRVRRARERCGPRFITQNVTNHPGVPLDEPIRTITTADQWGVVDGDWYRLLTIEENLRAMGFPDTYKFPDGAKRGRIITGIGNAVCPGQAEGILRQLQAA